MRTLIGCDNTKVFSAAKITVICPEGVLNHINLLSVHDISRMIISLYSIIKNLIRQKYPRCLYLSSSHWFKARKWTPEYYPAR